LLHDWALGFAPNALPSSSSSGSIASPRASSTSTVSGPSLSVPSTSTTVASSDAKSSTATSTPNGTNGYGLLVQTLGPGGSFGELALLYGAPRQATAIALVCFDQFILMPLPAESLMYRSISQDDVELWALDRNTFNRILRNIFAKLQDST
jgi:hypothetical protein